MMDDNTKLLIELRVKLEQMDEDLKQHFRESSEICSEVNDLDKRLSLLEERDKARGKMMGILWTALITGVVGFILAGLPHLINLLSA